MATKNGVKELLKEGINDLSAEQLVITCQIAKDLNRRRLEKATGRKKR